MLNPVAFGLVLVAVLGLGSCFSGYFNAGSDQFRGSPVEACRCAGQYIVDSSNCSAFYECDQDFNPLAFGCPHNLQFNPVNNVCDFASVVDCDANGKRPAVSGPDPCQVQP